MQYHYAIFCQFCCVIASKLGVLLLAVFAPLISVIGYRAVLGLCGYVVSNIAFLFAAVYFYR